jgi:RNA polymerase sigma-70 factor (ECF subfamily)
MNTTSVTLLERLRHPGEEKAWTRFVRLYTPLLYYWARHIGLSTDHAADLVQDVLVTLVQKLPELRYDPNKSFRAWLRTITLNQWRARCRRGRLPVESALDLSLLPGREGLEPFAEQEYRQHLVRRALQLMQREFEPTTWKACWELVVADRPAAEVAAELGVSVAVVYGAKSRVLRRLREELAGLLD